MNIFLKIFKQSKYILISYYAILLYSSLCFVSCVKEIEEKTLETNNEEIEISIKALLSDIFTKAPNDDFIYENETKIKSLYLFIYDNNGKMTNTLNEDNYVLEYKRVFTEADLQNIDANGATVLEEKIKINMSKAKTAVVVANPDQSIATSLDKLKIGSTNLYINIKKLWLYVNKIFIDGKYRAFNSDSIPPADLLLPWYGEVVFSVLPGEENKQINIPIKRAVSRIDLLLGKANDNPKTYKIDDQTSFDLNIPYCGLLGYPDPSAYNNTYRNVAKGPAVPKIIDFGGTKKERLILTYYIGDGINSSQLSATIKGIDCDGERKDITIPLQNRININRNTIYTADCNIRKDNTVDTVSFNYLNWEESRIPYTLYNPGSYITIKDRNIWFSRTNDGNTQYYSADDFLNNFKDKPNLREIRDFLPNKYQYEDRYFSSGDIKIKDVYLNHNPTPLTQQLDSFRCIAMYYANGYYNSYNYLDGRRDWVDWGKVYLVRYFHKYKIDDNAYIVIFSKDCKYYEVLTDANAIPGGFGSFEHLPNLDELLAANVVSRDDLVDPWFTASKWHTYSTPHWYFPDMVKNGVDIPDNSWAIQFSIYHPAKEIYVTESAVANSGKGIVYAGLKESITITLRIEINGLIKDVDFEVKPFREVIPYYDIN